MTDDTTTDLRQRLLLWHRVLAQMTGTLSLSYGGKGLKKSALDEWATRLETVSADMRSIHGVDSSRLDMGTRTVLRSAARTAPMGDAESVNDSTFSTKRGGHDGPVPEHPVDTDRRQTAERHREANDSPQSRETHHDLEVLKPSPRSDTPDNGSTPGQASKGPRKATRKAGVGK